jgi:hypothetical protein
VNVQCVSLARATERRDQIRREWIEERGFDVRFVDAFDRRRVGVEPLPFPYDDERTRARLGRSLSAGEIACATSHALLVRSALDAGLEELVVLEDDMHPLPHTTPDSVAAAIESCQTAFPQVSVLLMHEQTGPVRVAETRGTTRLVAPELFGYRGYRFVWLSRKALGILDRDLSRMLLPADHYWASRFVPLKNLALPAEPLARHDGATSYIGAAERGGPPRQYLD